MVTYCKRCVMNDSSDSTIRFDENGICDYCTSKLKEKERVYFPNEEGERKLNEILEKIKATNKDKKYDCVMGISGGLDSSYLAYLGYNWGLRILAVHIDDGFDTEISKNNIKKLCEACHVELRTIKPDPEQFYDLTLAYMKAGVPNIAIPQDNILVAFLYKTLKEEGVKYFLSGGNFALESILQRSNTFSNLDVINIKAIHKKYGTKPIDKLDFISNFEKKRYEVTGKIIEIRPLNYVDYNRDRAFAELSDFCGFQYYGRKHLENILTAFIQLYWLPKKFGVDKRSSHLSSMIISGQITREEAMRELSEPLYDEKMMKEYIVFTANKLGISVNEIDAYINADNHQHDEYDSENDLIVTKAKKLVKRIIGRT